MTTPRTLTSWVLAATIERELIDVESSTRHNVAFATRPLNRYERQAGVKFADIDDIITVNTEDGEPIIGALYAAAVAAALVEVFGENEEEGADDDTIDAAIAAALLMLLLSKPKRTYTRERAKALPKITGLIEASYTGGVATALDEAQDQGQSITGWVRPDPPAVLGVLAGDIVDHPNQRTTQRMIDALQTPQRAMLGTITRGELAAIGEDTSQKGTVDKLHQANQSALGVGRNDTANNFVGEFIQAVASEILDGNTCSACNAIDGTIFLTLDEAYAAYPTGNYVNCAGGSRCRGVLVFLYEAPSTG